MGKRLSTIELQERAARLLRVSLAKLPTPLQECPRLSEALGGQVRLFMKRDDLTAPGLGGNKVRKLEFILGEAKARGCDVIVHGLAGQSNLLSVDGGCRRAGGSALLSGSAQRLQDRGTSSGQPAAGPHLRR